MMVPRIDKQAIVLGSEGTMYWGRGRGARTENIHPKRREIDKCPLVYGVVVHCKNKQIDSPSSRSDKKWDTLNHYHYNQDRENHLSFDNSEDLGETFGGSTEGEIKINLILHTQ